MQLCSEDFFSGGTGSFMLTSVTGSSMVSIVTADVVGIWQVSSVLGGVTFLTHLLFFFSSASRLRYLRFDVTWLGELGPWGTSINIGMAFGFWDIWSMGQLYMMSSKCLLQTTIVLKKDAQSSLS